MNYKVDKGTDYITISDDKGEIVTWVKDEWEEDESVYMAIIEALNVVINGMDLRKRIGK